MLVVGIGGTTRHGSSTERALRACLEAATASDVETVLLARAIAMAQNKAAERDLSARFVVWDALNPP